MCDRWVGKKSTRCFVKFEGCCSTWVIHGNTRDFGLHRHKEGKGALTVVDHHVHASLREDGRLAWCEDLGDEPRAVLLVHVRCRVTEHGDDVVGGSWVVVRWQHGAWAEIQHRHCLTQTWLVELNPLDSMKR